MLRETERALQTAVGGEVLVPGPARSRRRARSVRGRPARSGRRAPWPAGVRAGRERRWHRGWSPRRDGPAAAWSRPIRAGGRGRCGWPRRRRAAVPGTGRPLARGPGRARSAGPRPRRAAYSSGCAASDASPATGPRHRAVRRRAAPPRAAAAWGWPGSSSGRRARAACGSPRRTSAVARVMRARSTQALRPQPYRVARSTALRAAAVVRGRPPP